MQFLLHNKLTINNNIFILPAFTGELVVTEQQIHFIGYSWTIDPLYRAIPERVRNYTAVKSELLRNIKILCTYTVYTCQLVEH